MIGAILRKGTKELSSDPVLLTLTLILAPFFVLLYKLIFLEGMTVYDVVLYAEPATTETSTSLDDLESRLRAVEYPGGGRLFDLRRVSTRTEGLWVLENRDARIMVELVPNRLHTLSSNRDAPFTVTVHGDHSDPYYVLASRLFRTALEDYLVERGWSAPAVVVTEVPLGISRDKTEFENYVPGLIVFSTLVLMFLFVLVLARESESRVFIRYRIARLPGLAYVAAYAILFAVLAVAAALLALGTAFLLGFRSPDSVMHDMFSALAICATLSVAASGAAFLVAGFARSSTQGFQLAAFPFMILVFFSGSVYPFPRIPIAMLGSRTIGLFDVLPSTHAVSALHKLLTFGTRPAQLIYELAGLAVTSLALLVVGATVFVRRKLPPLEGPLQEA